MDEGTIGIQTHDSLLRHTYIHSTEHGEYDGSTSKTCTCTGDGGHGWCDDVRYKIEELGGHAAMQQPRRIAACNQRECLEGVTTSTAMSSLLIDR